MPRSLPLRPRRIRSFRELVRHYAPFWVAMLWLMPLNRALADDYVRYSGEARTPDRSRVLYREEHVLRLRGTVLVGRIVLYECPRGGAFARKTLRYAETPFTPGLHFEDQRNGNLRVLETRGQQVHLVHRDGPQGLPVEHNIPLRPGLVADAGFDEFVRQNWDSLHRGRSVAFDLLVLSDGSEVSLSIKLLRHARAEDDDVDVYRVALPGLLGWITTAVDLTYSSSDRTLRHFEGPSNLPDEAGRQQVVTIRFPAEDRRPSDEDAWTAAGSAPLVSGCVQ